MEGLIFDMLETIKKHYTTHRDKNKALQKQLDALAKMLSDDLHDEEPTEEKHYLFFNDLSQEAQFEFLDNHCLDYEQIEQDKAILTYKLIKRD